MKRLTVGLTACAISLGLAASFATADIDDNGVMSGGIVGNSNYFSYQILEGVDANGTTINVFRMYANRNAINAAGFGSGDHEILESNGSAADPHGLEVHNGTIWWATGAANDPPQPPNEFFFPIPAFSYFKYETFLTIGTATLGDSADNQYVGDIDFVSDGFAMESAVGGSWAHLPGTVSQGLIDNDVATMGTGHTLMLQISTTGDSLHYDLNIKTRDLSGSGHTFENAGSIYIPAPGALALLGIAGIASRRRRRA